MAKEVMTLSATRREDSGTSGARRLRREGRVPCIIYGHKQEPAAVTVDQVAFEKAVRHHTRMLDLDVGGAKERVLLHALQYDTFGIYIIHADFIRVAMDEVIRMKVPVELRGRAVGEQHGGVAEQLLTEVEVECLPADIPESVSLVISDLDVGQSVRVSQLVAPAKVKIVTEPTYLVVTVAAPKKAEEVVAAPVEEAVAATGTGPEVITRGKGEEEGEAAEGDKKDKGEKKEKK